MFFTTPLTSLALGVLGRTLTLGFPGRTLPLEKISGGELAQTKKELRRLINKTKRRKWFCFIPIKNFLSSLFN